MPAQKTIQYVRTRNLEERCYVGQSPPGGCMHNQVYCDILAQLEDELLERSLNDPIIDPGTPPILEANDFEELEAKGGA